MDREQLQALIQADLDGELSVTERADLARRLLQDPEARRLHDEFRRTDRLLRDIGSVEPPHGMRETILQGHSRPRQHGWPGYRVAAVVLGGLLIAGLSYLLIDADVPRTNLQGSFGAGVGPDTSDAIFRQDHLSMRAEGAEVNASLQRQGQGLRLELKLSTTNPSEVIARIDPATTAFAGDPGDAQLDPESGLATVQLATGSQVFVLDFSGAGPIQLQLRSAGRLLAEGRLSVSKP
ncbi:MAG: hypothetical protein M3O07_06270 [Pseudomonadota bacterium]|nr:hypothetical protein [Pseudomonadota bacterium]